MPNRRARRLVIVVAALLLTARCSGPASPSPTPPPGGTSNVLVGAGDIAVCGSSGTEATAALLDNIPGTVFTAGDNAYFQGTAQQFRECYDPTWGRQKPRTRPAPGNHDYESPGAIPYFNYFGPAAGPAGLGYYSYMLGSWLVLSLNSNVPADFSSLQVEWLRNELAVTAARCTIAYFHHPLFSSGPSGSNRQMRDVWRLLFDHDADVVVNGHDHLYERFAPQEPDGRPNGTRGIRQFIVGTGGAPLYTFGPTRPNSERRLSTFGVLRLTLHEDGYEWAFVQAGGAAAGDSGSGTCH